MSAGKFELYNYVTDDGTTVPIKLQPETIAAVFGGAINASPPGTPSAGYPSAIVSRSKRSIGIHPRTVTISLTTGTPAGYLAGQTYRIPCLSQTVFDSATKGAAASYLGGSGKVVGKSKEAIV